MLGGSGASVNSTPAWTIGCSTLVAALTAFALALPNMTIGNPRRLGVATLVSSLALSLGSALIVAAPTLTTGVHPLVVGSVLVGVGDALLLVLWGEHFAALGSEASEATLPLTWLVAFVCLLLAKAPAPLGIGLAVLMPLLSGLCLYAGQAHLHGRDARKDGLHPGKSGCQASRASLALECCAIFAAYVLISVMSGVETEGDGLGFMGSLPRLVGVLFAMILLAAFVRHAIQVNMAGLLRLTTPLLTCGAVAYLQHCMVGDALGDVLMSVADVAFMTIAYLHYPRLAERRELPARMGVGLSMAAVQAGLLTGSLLGQAAGDTEAGASGMGVDLAIEIALCALVALASLVLTPRRSRAGNADASGAPRADEQARPREISMVDKACDELAQAYRLTNRERDVLGYLARGRTQTFIREELLLSKNTVAYYVKGVYAKTGVHSKQELIDLVERQAATS